MASGFMARLHFVGILTVCLFLSVVRSEIQDVSVSFDKSKLSGPCGTTDHCVDPEHMRCINYKCACSSCDYEKGGNCVSKGFYIGDPCTMNNHCAETLQCRGNKCGCDEQSEIYGFSSGCMKKSGADGPCKYDEHCMGTLQCKRRRCE